MAKQYIRYFYDLLVIGAVLALMCLPWGSWLGTGFSLTNMLQPPSFEHPFGTDNLGRDLAVRCSDALRFAVLPLWGGVIAASIMGFLAAAGCLMLQTSRRGRLMMVPVQISATALASIPVGIAAFTWAVLSEKAGILPVLYALMALFAVRVFLQTINLYQQDRLLGYWDAHAAMGGRVRTRIFQYGLRGSWKWRLLDGIGFHLRAAVAIEASLSYLGFGIQEPTASFGNMLASHFDTYLKGDFTTLLIVVAMLSLAAAFPASLVSVLNALSTNAFRGRKSSRNDTFGGLAETQILANPNHYSR